MGLPWRAVLHAYGFSKSCPRSRLADGRDTRALQAYLGHKNIMHTVRYTELAADRFKSWWDD
jgi:type 1 fimbriae regulatory protein FimB/type 1 fimbriae regulatory protein FimE